MHHQIRFQGEHLPEVLADPLAHMDGDELPAAVGGVGHGVDVRSGEVADARDAYAVSYIEERIHLVGVELLRHGASEDHRVRGGAADDPRTFYAPLPEVQEAGHAALGEPAGVIPHIGFYPLRRGLPQIPVLETVRRGNQLLQGVPAVEPQSGIADMGVAVGQPGHYVPHTYGIVRLAVADGDDASALDDHVTVGETLAVPNPAGVACHRRTEGESAIYPVLSDPGDGESPPPVCT